LKALAAILPEGPGQADIHKTIGLLSVRAGDYEAGAAAYRAALKLDPGDDLTRLNLARVNGRAGRREAYRAGLAELVEKFPDRPDYRAELAGALREDGLLARAKEHYQALIAARPGDMETRLIFLELLEQTRDREGLTAQYAQLSELTPGDKVVLYNYGALLFDQKKWAEAAEAFQKVLALDAGEDSAREYLLAIYQRLDQREAMLEQALDLYRRNPAKVVYRTFVLNTYENAKDWPRFAEVAEECAGLRPDDPEGWRLLARGQARLNRKEAAATSLWRAAEAAEDQTEPWLTAGEAYSELDDLGRSREAYRKALTLDPKNKRATQAIAEIDRKSAGEKKGG
jgi:tetratricopeptide (TPR) repeat protein